MPTYRGAREFGGGAGYEKTGDILGQLLWALLNRQELQAENRLPAAEKAIEESKITGDPMAAIRLAEKNPKIAELYTKYTGEQYPALQEVGPRPPITQQTPSGMAYNMPQAPLKVPTPEYPTTEAGLKMRAMHEWLGGSQLPPALRPYQQEMQAAPYEALNRVPEGMRPQAAEALGVGPLQQTPAEFQQNEFPYRHAVMAFQVYSGIHMTPEEADKASRDGTLPEGVRKQIKAAKGPSPQMASAFLAAWPDATPQEWAAFRGGQLPGRLPATPQPKVELTQMAHYAPLIGMSLQEAQANPDAFWMKAGEYENNRALKADRLEKLRGLTSMYYTARSTKNTDQTKAVMQNIYALYGLPYTETPSILDQLLGSGYDEKQPIDNVTIQLANTLEGATQQRLNRSTGSTTEPVGPPQTPTLGGVPSGLNSPGGDFWRQQKERNKRGVTTPVGPPGFSLAPQGPPGIFNLGWRKPPERGIA
jgi:hypothetical protein